LVPKKSAFGEGNSENRSENLFGTQILEPSDRGRKKKKTIPRELRKTRCGPGTNKPVLRSGVTLKTLRGFDNMRSDAEWEMKLFSTHPTTVHEEKNRRREETATGNAQHPLKPLGGKHYLRLCQKNRLRYSIDEKKKKKGGEREESIRSLEKVLNYRK